MGTNPRTTDMPESVHWLAIACNRHTSVLGYRCSTATGRHLWSELNWREWWPDESFGAGTYLHVHCFEDEKRYRVRCWYSVGGTKYRGRDVVSVTVGMHAGQLHWIIRTKGN